VPIEVYTVLDSGWELEDEEADHGGREERV
jgi:hypothetical protein